MALRRTAACITLGLTALPGASGLTSAPASEDQWPWSRKAQAETVTHRTSELRVHVTSIGGVGTTGIMEEMKQMSPAIVTNDPIDNDQIKHVPYSKLIGMAGFKRLRPQKVIYMYGDASRAIMSLDRRGWFMIQARKTRSDPFPHPFPKNLKQYVEDMNEDFFQFEKHFDSYYTQCDMPVAFLRATEKTDHIKELAEFLEVNSTEARRVLVPWKQAASALQFEQEVVPLEFNPDVLPSNHSYDDVTPETKARLKGKLSSLLKKYDSLPGFKAIIPGKDCHK